MEKYIAMIKVLNDWESVTPEQILNKAGISIASPKEYFNFLVKLELIREKIVSGKKTYTITQKGQRLRSFFNHEYEKSTLGETGLIRID